MPSNDKDQNERAQIASTETVQPRQASLPVEIGPYKTLEILGEGGMGVVYRAQQTRPVKREVALKLIKLGMDTKQVIARFESERQALALMDHPNVAKVFDAGATEKGRPYFVMELVHGLPITEHCDRHKLSIDQRLDLFTKTCEAIQHAHQKGIIHRDIKPSNILVEYRDGQATPKIIDFGVAKATSQRLTEKTLFTEQGQMIGTPAYMSPEQADLSTQDIDTRSDIYSLGVLLYELLTGMLPFDANSLRSAGFGEIQRIVRDEEPQKPSTRVRSGGVASSGMEDAADSGSLELAAKKRRSDPQTLIKRIRGDLDCIVMKCLEKDRARRYETANGLAQDIRRHLSNEPVLASTPSVGYRLRKLIKRNRSGAVAVAVVAFALVSATIVSVSFALSEARQRRIAVNAERDQSRAREAADQARAAEEKQRKLAEQRESALRETICRNGVMLAEQALAFLNIGRMKDVLHTACTSGFQQWEWYYEFWQSDRSMQTFKVGSPLSSLALSPDGQMLAVSDLENIRILTTQTGKTIRVWSARGSGFSLRFSPDGKWIISHGTSGARVWRVADGSSPLRLSGPNWNIKGLDVAPNGDQIAAISSLGRIKMWDRLGRAVTGFRSPKTSAMVLGFHPLDGTFTTVSVDGLLSVCDATTGELLHTKEIDTARSCMVFSPDGTSVLMGGKDGNIIIYDVTTQEVSAPIPAHDGPIHQLAYSKDGRYFATAGDDKTIRLWNATTNRPIALLTGHEAAVTSVAFSPVEDTLTSVSLDNTVKVWELRNQVDTLNIECSYRVSPDGSRISDNCRRYLRVYDVSDGQELWRIASRRASVCAFDKGNQLSCVDESTIRRYSAAEGEEIRVEDWGDSRAVVVLSVSDSQLVVARGSIYNQQTLALVDLQTGRIKFELENSTGTYRRNIRSHGNTKISPDGELVANNLGGTVKVWSARTGNLIDAFVGSEPIAIGYAGAYLAVSNGGTIDVWDLRSKEFIELIGSQEYDVTALAISPDNSRIVSGDAQGTVVFWDISGGNELLRVKRHKNEIRGIKFSADGTKMFTFGVGGFVQIWRAPGMGEQRAEERQNEDMDDSP